MTWTFISSRTFMEMGRMEPTPAELVVYFTHYDANPLPVVRRARRPSEFTVFESQRHVGAVLRDRPSSLTCWTETGGHAGPPLRADGLLRAIKPAVSMNAIAAADMRETYIPMRYTEGRNRKLTVCSPGGTITPWKAWFTRTTGAR